MSQKFTAKDISNGSLDQITTTGFYFGSNITEVTPYIKSHKWCLINALVNGNSANIFVVAGDAMALSIYRNGDGIYSYYPLATKSDLLQFKKFTVSIKTGTEKDLTSQMYYGSMKISNSADCPKNVLYLLPYGARSEKDAGRPGLISYRDTDTFCGVAHPAMSDATFIVNVLAIYKS